MQESDTDQTRTNSLGLEIIDIPFQDSMHCLLNCLTWSFIFRSFCSIIHLLAPVIEAEQLQLRTSIHQDHVANNVTLAAIRLVRTRQFARRHGVVSRVIRHLLNFSERGLGTRLTHTVRGISPTLRFSCENPREYPEKEKRALTRDQMTGIWSARL